MTHKDRLRFALRTIASQVGSQVAIRAITSLRRLDGGTLDSDFQLNLWDEICVDRALQDTGFSDAYDGELESILSHIVANLQEHERLALWLQTDEGFEWSFQEAQPEEVPPFDEVDVIRYVKYEHVYRQAEVSPSQRAVRHHRRVMGGET